MLARALKILLVMCNTVTAATLEWKIDSQPGIQWANIMPPGAGRAGFTRVAPNQSGITFSNFLTDERGITNQVYYSGSGVAVGDVNGDGLPDLYFCSLNGDNRLYRNLGGFRFEDVTGRAGIRCDSQPSTGTVLADVDGDGDLDLFVSSIGNGVRLFVNDGRGVFVEATGGLASNHATMTMALADIDGDGDLDLYAANYRRDTFQDEVNVRFRVRTIGGRPQIVFVNDLPAASPELTNRYYVDARGSVQENGEPDVLYLNNGKGSFTAVSWTDGTFMDAAGRPLASPPLDWGLSAMFRDMNADGAPDLYVCNDGDSPDRVWMNNGRGGFRELGEASVRLTSFSSMGVDFADINRDGFDDLFVTDMMGYEHATRHSLMPTRIMMSAGERRPAVPRNTLFLNRGDGTWAEIAQLAGVEASDWTWCPAFVDLDLDGYEDLLITTGLEKSLRNADDRARIDFLRRQGKLTRAEFLDARRAMRRLDVPNFAFRNRGDLTFEVTSKEWGFDARESSHGIALGDLDNDGDLDIVVSCLNAPPLVYRNDCSAPRIAVRLKGAGANTAGIGARVSVQSGETTLVQEMISGGRFLSGDQATRTFAAGAKTNDFQIEIRWRSGKKSTFRNAFANRIYEFNEQHAVSATARRPSENNPLFIDASKLLAHEHKEARFDDFARQPLLTRQLSHFGPGVCWANVAGSETLLVGAGQGSPLAMFRSLPKGGFTALTLPEISRNALDDLAGIVSWPLNSATTILAFAQSTYKSQGTNAVLMFELSSAGARPIASLPAWDSSPGALAASDMDGDGDLDLFVAGRVIPGRYPAPASSRVFRNDGTNFVFDAQRSKPFANIGLVNGAVFSDLDQDGRAELVLACEWGSIKIFKAEVSTLSDTTEAWGLQPLRGWWQGITAGDFNGDGRMDLVAGNWGRNHRFANVMTEPLRVYYADTAGDGVVNYFEAYSDPRLRKHVIARHWDMMAFRFPFLQQRVRGFTDYSTRSVEEVFGEHLARFEMLTASTLDSVVLLNRGNRFEAAPLPFAAQLAPVFGVSVADFDGNGTEDVFLAQNFSAVDSETSPLLAGRGVVLLGDGKGAFQAMPAADSGIVVSGDARGTSVADWNEDGRVDLCVSQNRGETRLLRNVGGHPGLRVTMANPVGVQIRIMYQDGSLGPMREVHAGSGWLSQDSFTLVLARPRAVKSLLVHGPNGRRKEIDVKENAQLVNIE